MCIDIYVDKVLVYTDCVVSTPSPLSATPSPLSPIISPSIIPIFHDIYVPSSSQIYTFAPSSINPSPSPIQSIIGMDNVLETPSAITIINTTISPSSSNPSNMSVPSNGTYPHYIEDHATVLNIVIVVASLVLLLCIFACKDRCKQKKVAPLHVEYKKRCKCYKKNPTLTEKPSETPTHTRPYTNQPPLPNNP